MIRAPGGAVKEETKMKERTLSNEKPNRGLRREADIVEEAAAEPVEQAVEETPKKESKVGVVTNCQKLNVRREATLENNIITTLLAGAVLVIDEDGSTDKFYKVITETGLEGYCMKQFIELS